MAVVYITVNYYNGETLLKSVQVEETTSIYDGFGTDPTGETDFLGWSSTPDGSNIIDRNISAYGAGCTTVYAVWSSPPDQSTIGGVFTAIADQVRAKNGTTDLIPAKQLYKKVGDIVTIKEGSSGCTATADDIRKGKTAITDGGTKITGTKVIPAYTMEYGSKIQSTASFATFTVYTTNPKRNSCKIYGFGCNDGTASVFVGDKKGVYHPSSGTNAVYCIGNLSDSTNSHGQAIFDSINPYAIRNSKNVKFYRTAVGISSFSGLMSGMYIRSSEFRYVIIDED